MPVANPSFSACPPAAKTGGPGILLFAKAPRPGACKTRLARRCGDRRAAGLYRAMLEHALSRASQLAPARVHLCCAPDTRDPFLARIARRYGAARVSQSGGDLGRRMHAAIRFGLVRYSSVVLMGSDQPQLDDDWYAEATGALSTPGHAWLAPTLDGGYWAIGLTRAEPRVFRGPTWSSAHVARQTMQRLHRCGYAVRCHPARRDVDDWQDWCKLPAAIRAALARRATMPGAIRTG